MPMKFYIDNYVARAKEVAYQVFVDYNYFLTSTMGHPNQEFGKRGLINC